MLCVYALTAAASPRLRSRGIDGEPLRTMTCGAVSAIVGELRAAPEPARDCLARYDAVIEQMARSHPALLPVRFGTCFPHAAELMSILEARQASFTRALRHVRGRAQMTVRVIAGERDAAVGQVAGSAAREVAGSASGNPADVRRAGPAQPTRRSGGAAYLRGRAAEAARQRHIPGFDPVRSAVRRWVRDERVEKRDRIATVYHLVPRSAAASYARALRVAAGRAGLHVRVSGPFPPYAFADW